MSPNTTHRRTPVRAILAAVTGVAQEVRDAERERGLARQETAAARVRIATLEQELDAADQVNRTLRARCESQVGLIGAARTQRDDAALTIAALRRDLGAIGTRERAAQTALAEANGQVASLQDECDTKADRIAALEQAHAQASHALLEAVKVAREGAEHLAAVLPWVDRDEREAVEPGLAAARWLNEHLA